MNQISNYLRDNYGFIKEHLVIGYANWDKLVEGIERQERKDQSDFYDEQIWTFLLCCGYASSGFKGVEKLASLLTNTNIQVEKGMKIWFEVLPVSPRQKEGQTHVDLAIGAIKLRNGTESGIEYDKAIGNWICLCEMKWYSDISYNVNYDRKRNQLARVIENTITFQYENNFPKSPFFTLVTPEYFRNQSQKSRLYHYKYEEYKNNHKYLSADLTNSILDKRIEESWKYPPDVENRIKDLKMNWVSYESLFENMPASKLKSPLLNFLNKYNGTDA